MVSANNKITDHECIDIFIENGNGQKIQITEMDIFKYNKDRFNNELSAIMEFNEIDNILGPPSNVFFTQCLFREWSHLPHV